MYIRAWLTAGSERAIRADCWLSSLDWEFCREPGGTDWASSPDLVIADLACVTANELPEPQSEAGLWVILSACQSPWLASADTHFLRGYFDLDVLRNRLIAWCWLKQSLCPCLFDSGAFDIVNGSLSLYRASISPALHLFPLEVSVQPVTQVGGDIMVRADFADRSLLVLADASGHGESAALDAALLVQGLSLCLAKQPCSSDAVRQLNTFLYDNTGEGRYVAAVLIELDWRRRQAFLLNAGMPDVLLFDRAQFEQRYPSGCLPLGLQPDMGDGAMSALPWDSWKQVLVHSDGFVEADLPFLLSRVIRLSSAAKSDAFGSGPLPSIPLLFASRHHDDMSSLAFSLPDPASR